MSESSRSQGKIIFLTSSQLALWQCEILGQLSDGMWENSRPSDHWQFWHRLDADIGMEPHVVMTGFGGPRRSGYVLTSLIEYVGERMVNIGKLAKAGCPTDACRAAEYMPASFEEFVVLKQTGGWQHDFIANYMQPITTQIAEAYYKMNYTLKDLRADLKVIKQAMKDVRYPS